MTLTHTIMTNDHDIEILNEVSRYDISVLCFIVFYSGTTAGNSGSASKDDEGTSGRQRFICCFVIVNKGTSVSIVFNCGLELFF
jgi:hypothetical protein